MLLLFPPGCKKYGCKEQPAPEILHPPWPNFLRLAPERLPRNLVQMNQLRFGFQLFFAGLGPDERRMELYE